MTSLYRSQFPTYQFKMSKPPSKAQHIRHYTKVSGAQLGKNAKRIAGCECCNFMELAHSKTTKGQPNPLHKDYHSTGAPCPRCGGPVRVFDSQAEFGRARELKLMEEAGMISGLAYQVKYALTVKSATSGNTTTSRHLCFYVADFTYVDKAGEFIVEDVKNKAMVVTELALHKMRHFELEYGIEVAIVGR